MFTEFYPEEVHVVVTITIATLFFIISAFGNYVILFKTPGAMAGYKYHFFYLNTSYQVTIFFLAVYGRVEISFPTPTLHCIEYSGLVQIFGRNFAFIETFTGTFSQFNVINSILLSFLFRFCHVCYPKSSYSENPLWERTVNVTITVVSTVPLSVLYLASIVFYMEDPQTKRDGYITVCFGSSDLMNVFSIAAFLYVTSVIVLCLAFISRVVWVMKTKMANVSKKTKDMQRMLTITLIVTVSIPIVLGGLPVFLAFYAVSIRVENAAQMFRIIFLASIGQGLTNITSTLLLVKPYRLVILSLMRWKKKITKVAAVTQTACEI
ncbi:hypothetical protein QR680_015637 [Steinernema hermaphroditum]|uniref:Uncharacterized protein n=1 Tax=Steinernema hermaphroditum TaxID=289476 RepID=A0AA39LL94_9BILA|nr:hypothetical protein QR680_015637 [Steinernema hermaphroditum]